MQRVKIFVFFLLLAPLPLLAQTDQVDEFIDDLLGEDDLINELIKSSSVRHLVQVGVDYNDKTYFSGRDIGIDQFHIVPRISYVHSKGFFSSISGVYYSGFSPKWDYTSLLLGYGNSFDKHKKFNWSVSYARYIYSNDIEGLFENAISASVDYLSKNRNFGSVLESTFLFGGDTSFQLTSTTFKEFELYQRNGFEISLRPQIEITIAQQTIEQIRIDRDGVIPVIIYTQNHEFGLINTEVKFPVQCSYKSFDFELGYTLNIPNSLPDEGALKSRGFFNISLSYTMLFN
ncbi:conserved exported protein of unknown function [Tenacibaculum sp. 190130A14a]|uniref:DUF481 domain-containing protein n=1 Tax=Tenacibaculum polynesiense TaxID=3137857 RepID=A0ABP1F2Y7_9FLAO